MTAVAEMTFQRRRSQRFIQRLDHATGVDGGNPFRHHRDLGPTDSAIQRMQLTVDVGKRDVVGINQSQPPDTATCQRLGGP